MRFRRQLIITLGLLCHLTCTPLVTSQLLPEAPHSSSSSAPQLANVSDPGEEVTIKAREQEKAGDVYTLRGDVEITYRNLVFRADEVSYNAASGDITAAGHLVLEGGPHDEHIEASRGTYNLRTGTGSFHDVVGTTGARFEGKSVTLTSSSPFAFSGKRVEKVSRDRYIVHSGSVTSCELPNPKWSFNAQKIVVDVGGSAKIYNSTFRVKGVPVVYFPFAAHPVERLGRQSGFLIPTFGASSRKGTIIGESFYWAISRSVDATIGAEYYSSRGWSQSGEFRARPSETSYINVKYFGVLDRGFWEDTPSGPRYVDQGGQDVTVNAEGQLPWGFRGVISAEYLSSYVFRLAFTESFSQTVNSEVKSNAFVSKNWHGYSINSLASRYQNFQSTQRGDAITILRMPTLEVGSVDRQVGRTRFFWGFDAAGGGVSRREPGFATADLVGRFDLRPRGSIAWTWKGWSFRPEVALRNTYYTQRRVAIGPFQFVSDDAVNRRALEAAFEFRAPVLGRVFERTVFGHKVKHTIEPRVIYRFANGIDNFQDILRFDARDILSDTNEVEYALVHRIYAKKPDDKGIAHEVLSWEVAQKYFVNEDFGGAVVPGRRNVLTTTVDFAGIAFLTEPRRFSPIISRLRMRTSASTDLQWQFDYDIQKGRINASTVLANYRFGDFFLGGSHAFLHVPGELFVPAPVTPPDRFNQFRALIGYGHPNKRGFSTAANLGFDANFEFLQYGAYQWSYNWDCCGLAMEYRRFALGSVRNENQFRFAFTLANVATFGNLRLQERLF